MCIRDSPYGIYVELENTVEGMIPLAALPEDDYSFSASTLTLQGRRPENHFSLGDRVTVTVARVDVGMRQIDFTLTALAQETAKEPIGK